MTAALERLRTVLAGGGAPPAAAPPAGFLPDFCAGATLARVALLAEALALVITLVTRRISASLFTDLLLISLFVQWIALASAAALCALRARLARLPPAGALTAAFALPIGVTAGGGEAAVWVLWASGKIASPRPEWYAYFQVQNIAVAAIVETLALSYLLAVHRLHQRTLSEARARLQALRARLRPHFLFNSMNLIAGLMRGAPAQAEHALEDMADLLRLMLVEDESLVPVKNEIAVARKYIALETLRLDRRLEMDWDVGRFPRRAVMPLLTLQPLLEHAIRHGVEPRPGGGRVALRLWEQDGGIQIEVSAPRADGRIEADRDRALAELRSRLASHYNEAIRLEERHEGDRAIVRLSLPMRGDHP
jgi:two-component system sensor histidine kinase AlgZ